MKHVNLLVSAIPEMNFDSLAKKIFFLLQVDNYEERSSIHYVEERYYVGRTASLEVKVMLSDDADSSDLPYWIRLSAIGQEDLEEAEIDNLVHASFLPFGLRVARMENFGQVSEVRIDYQA
jgi:hypothetical protein